MRHWKRVVAVLAVAAVALLVEGWVARAQAAPTLFKGCTYTRTAGEHGQPPYSLAPTLGLVKVTLRTNRGDLVLTLDRANAPCAVHSFTHLALRRFFNQTPCPRHTRAILECGVGRPGYHFAAELTGHETYPRGTVALSNTPGRGNSSAFFITPADAPLSPTSTVLGRVTTGQPVLDRLTTSAPATLLEVLIG
ncbi:peptidylprolyl isomerase [Kribbella sp. NPDC004875]|uniref:peptidylprolyl isomerase n=1 Tax=Kribbella sp. NPDC004875 TaxID=3364107 RepID=UPI0036BDFB9D